jgi:hypothetical protein
VIVLDRPHNTTGSYELRLSHLTGLAASPFLISSNSSLTISNDYYSRVCHKVEQHDKIRTEYRTPIRKENDLIFAVHKDKQSKSSSNVF